MSKNTLCRGQSTKSISPGFRTPLSNKAYDGSVQTFVTEDKLLNVVFGSK